MKNKRIISIVLVTILTILFIMPTTFAAGISSDVWNSIDNFNNAKKQSNDDDIIKYGKEVFAGLENAEQTTLVKEILSSRYYEVADAYDRRDDFATAAYYYQKYIPYGEFMGWKDGVRIAKSKILQYTETAQMFTETNVPQVYHGSKNEPQMGVLYGEVSEQTKPNESVILLYVDYGNPLNGWDKHILDTARSRNVAVEIAWNIQEEGLGLAKIPDQTKLITDFLEELNEYSDVPMFLRIGAEMNIWEDKANPKEFITAFRHIANLVREKTDHIATVWSVSHASEWNTNMEDFYPGDEYVDWIGISAYMVKHFQGKEWKKSERHNEVTYSAGDAADPIMVINEVMTKFGDRKPVMLAECGSARYTTSLKEDSTNWAVTNMERMYTYVPMVYPQVKLIAYFNTYFEGETSDYKIEGHPKMQDTYNKLIEQPHFIQNSFNNSAQLTYKPVKDGLEVENGSLPIYTYPHVYGDAEPSVNYYIDGNFAGTSNKLPYKQWLDFSQYSVGTHKVKSVVYSHGIEVASTEANVSKKRSINVKINDEVLKTSVTPVMENDRILVPMRDIFEALGAEVTWDDGTRTATGIKDDIQVSITINENTLVKNGEKIELSVSSKLINEKTMVPIRAISEAFEATVTWNDETSTVSINI